jgi:hypothetical protein
MPEIDADVVLARARELGQDWIDADTAARIATGATAAIRAVLELESSLESGVARSSVAEPVRHAGDADVVPLELSAGERDSATFPADLARLAGEQ